VVPPQSELLLALYQAGRLGRKTARGFFDYSTNDQPLLPGTEAIRLAAAHGASPIECSDAELTLHLFVPMVASASDLLARQAVANVAEVRTAMVGGLGCRGQAADLPGWARGFGRSALLEWGERLRLQGFDPAALC
jgi:hypothetical protein